MKYLFLFLLFSFSIAEAQVDLLPDYRRAASLFQAEKHTDALPLWRALEPKCNEKDTLYKRVLWYYSHSLSFLAQESIQKQDWNQVITYSLEGLPLIDKGKILLDSTFEQRKYWFYKSLVVAYFGLNELEKAAPYQRKLEEGYKEEKLPEGLALCYNFEFFKVGDKNVWGYEYYPNLGDAGTQGDFSKIIYYIYSTKPDGTDKQQMYKLHVLKVQKTDKSIKYDYVLTRRYGSRLNETTTPLAYSYKSPINYKYLRQDVRDIISGNTLPGVQPMKKH